MARQIHSLYFADPRLYACICKHIQAHKKKKICLQKLKYSRSKQKLCSEFALFFVLCSSVMLLKQNAVSLLRATEDSMQNTVCL